MGRPKFIPKLPLPFDDHHPHLIHPTLDRPNSHPKLIQSAVLLQCTFRTDRPTDRWDRRQLCTESACAIASERRVKNSKRSPFCCIQSVFGTPLTVWDSFFHASLPIKSPTSTVTVFHCSSLAWTACPIVNTPLRSIVFGHPIRYPRWFGCTFYAFVDSSMQCFLPHTMVVPYTLQYCR